MGIIGNIICFDSATVKVNELFITTQSTANICKFRLHGCTLMHLLASTEAAEPTNWKSCLHTSGNTFYAAALTIALNAVSTNAMERFFFFPCEFTKQICITNVNYFKSLYDL